MDPLGHGRDRIISSYLVSMDECNPSRGGFMKATQLYVPLKDWGQWRRTDKDFSNLRYRCPLGEVKTNNVSNEEMCHIQKAVDHLEILYPQYADALDHYYVKQTPTSKACQQLKIKKTKYDHCIAMGYIFIVGRVFT